MLSNLSVTAVLYINLALGLFVTVSNGGALALTLSGRGNDLVGMIPEISAWVTAGVILLLTSVYALTQKQRVTVILRFQSYAILVLVFALAAWALTIMLNRPPDSGRVIWSVGYLSAISLYAVALYSRVRRGSLIWILVPICVAIDIGTFLKVAGT